MDNSQFHIAFRITSKIRFGGFYEGTINLLSTKSAGYIECGCTFLWRFDPFKNWIVRDRGGSIFAKGGLFVIQFYTMKKGDKVMSGAPLGEPHLNAPLMSNTSWLRKFFKIAENRTTIKTELLAGLTTFMTMSYIIFVNPLILADAGIPKSAAFTATIISSLFATILLALWANYPIAIAPGMGLNAFFTYTVVIGHHLSWQTALGAVFISGVVFLILTVTGIRQIFVYGVPQVMRSSIVVGVGMFIAFIGFKNGGIVIGNKDTLVSLGNFTSPSVLLTVFGLIAGAFLMAKRVKGAFVFTILLTTILSMIFGNSPAPRGIQDVVSWHIPSMTTFFALDIGAALKYGIFSIIFSFTIVELFDNLGTVIGLTRKAGMEKENGEIPNLNRALTADAIGTICSSCCGTTALNMYIENATGIEVGGRTGLTALVVAAFFALSLLAAPLVGLIPAAATAPILIIVGALMLSEITHIKFDDYTDAIPAFLTMILMPLTFSISEGLAFGFITYTVVKLLTGKLKEIHWVMYIISASFIINFMYH